MDSITHPVVLTAAQRQAVRILESSGYRLTHFSGTCPVYKHEGSGDVYTVAPDGTRRDGSAPASFVAQ